MNCPVCCDFLLEPQIFNCGHTFCINCTIKILKNTKSLFSTPLCPVCKSYINHLFKNFKLDEILVNLCKIFEHPSGQINTKELYSELNHLCEQKIPSFLIENGKQLIIGNNGLLTFN